MRKILFALMLMALPLVSCSQEIPSMLQSETKLGLNPNKPIFDYKPQESIFAEYTIKNDSVANDNADSKQEEKVEENPLLYIILAVTLFVGMAAVMYVIFGTLGGVLFIIAKIMEKCVKRR